MEQQESDKAAPVANKKSKARLVGIIVAAVLVLGAGAAGAVMGPKLFGAGAQAKPEHASEESAEAGEEQEEDGNDAEKAEEPKAKGKEAKDGVVHEITNLQPIIVDVAAADGPARHLKIVLSIEHPEGIKEADFKSYVPRAREAAIILLRSQTYEQLSDPKNFENVRKELNQVIIDAVGKKRAKRTLISDFVTQ